ncbi:MAC/perforin domain-containing protein [Microbulbifer sp. SA54]|uniref:MAC/perforin domain-containing protein n=1 Tax=Microbulbifer sp. SA54 TaxID=3401577 RepID=UPI003AAE404E
MPDTDNEYTLRQFVGSISGKFKNISYLGRLFDITKINPLDLEESSLLLTALEFLPDDFKPVADGSRLLPEGVGYRPETGGDQISESQMIFESSTLEKKFSQHVKVNAGLEGVIKASASRMFNTFARTNRGRRSMFTWMSAEVEAPAIRLLDKDDGYSAPLKISQELKNAVQNLINANAAEYDIFIQRFGTHFANEVTFGGIAYQTIRIDADTYESLVQSGVEIGTEAEATFKKFSAGASNTEKNELSEEFQRKTETKQEQLRFRGGTPNSDINAWMASVPLNPAPIKVSLRQLDELMTEQNFPDITDIDTIRGLLRQAIDKYIKSSNIGDPNNIFSITQDNMLQVSSYEGENGIGTWVARRHPLLQLKEEVSFAFSSGKDLLFTIDKTNQLKCYEFTGVGESMEIKEPAGKVICHNFLPKIEKTHSIIVTDDGMIFVFQQGTNNRFDVFWYQYLNGISVPGWQTGSGSDVYYVASFQAFCTGDHKLYFYMPAASETGFVARNQYLGSSGERDWVIDGDPQKVSQLPWDGVISGYPAAIVGRQNGVFFPVDDSGNVYWCKDNGMGVESSGYIAAPGSRTRINDEFDLKGSKFIF